MITLFCILPNGEQRRQVSKYSYLLHDVVLPMLNMTVFTTFSCSGKRLLNKFLYYCLYEICFTKISKKFIKFQMPGNKICHSNSSAVRFLSAEIVMYTPVVQNSLKEKAKWLFSSMAVNIIELLQY